MNLSISFSLDFPALNIMLFTKLELFILEGEKSFFEKELLLASEKQLIFETSLSCEGLFPQVRVWPPLFLLT